MKPFTGYIAYAGKSGQVANVRIKNFIFQPLLRSAISVIAMYYPYFWKRKCRTHYTAEIIDSNACKLLLLQYIVGKQL